MRIFLTGASGFIGSAVVRELIGAGHQVLGLARSDAAAEALANLGVEAHRGELSDIKSLAAGARMCEGVIHTAFIHDWANYAPAAETDRRAIETLGAALAGTNRPLVVTGGILFIQPHGALAMEQDRPNPSFPRKSEDAGLAAASQGVRASVLRLPPSVHGDGDHGFVPGIIKTARERRVSAYVGEGLNRWPAIHRLDAARLFRLALEQGSAGASYHGVADEGVPFRQIAEVIGRRLNVPIVSITPEEAGNHFGWLGHFVSTDCPASSAQTQQRLGWRPMHPGLIPDLDRPSYFQA
jgi:nucleoside-diphosphate-sugar epimerase